MYARTLAAAVATAGLVLAFAGSASAGLAERLGEGVRVDRQEESGKVGFIGTRPGAPIETGAPASATPRQVARTFIAEHAAAFGLASDAAGLRATESHRTLAGNAAVRLQQTHAGVPVLGGELVVNVTPSGDVASVLGETSPSPRVATDPRISAEKASATAVAAVARKYGATPSELAPTAPDLYVYDPEIFGAPDPLGGKPRLAWVLEVESARDAPIREFVVVDAATGAVALQFSQIAEALDRVVCDANNNEAKYPCEAPYARAEGDPEVPEPPDDNNDIDFAYDFAGDTYEFFADKFGRDSLDDNGMQLVSTVDFCFFSDNPQLNTCPDYPNAFWDGEQMVYGEGFASADDVVGHELAHGVTEFSSHLFYYYQSGAINESMSDVFGELIDQANGVGSDDPADRWLVGEDVPSTFDICDADPHAIRNMADPTDCGDPDRMRSPNYWADPDNDLLGDGDAGGVHVNSGVGNKAAFLITDGGSFNGQTVTGVGPEKTARIYYEVNTSMLTSASDYRDLGNALNQACANLVGTAGITSADCSQVSKAVTATEMLQDPPAAPAPEAPTPAETCTGGSPVTLFLDDLENPLSGNWTKLTIIPPNVWFYPQNPNPIIDATYATSGETNFWGVNDDNITDSSIATTTPLAIPENAYLRFNHAYGFEDGLVEPIDPGEDPDLNAYDGGVLEYSTNNGATWVDAGPLITFNGYNDTIFDAPNDAVENPLKNRNAFTHESNGYISSLVNLGPLAGQSVRFRFRIGTDGVLPDYGWFIDDVHVFRCVVPPPPDGGPGAPDTKIKKAKANSRKRQAKFTFTGSGGQGKLSFECKLDRKKFKPCSSPRKYKRLKPGKHKFAVRAIDARGVADPTPAKKKFKIKRSKRR